MSAAVLAIAGLTAVGAVMRTIVAHQPLFADELSTYWISATHGLGGVLSLLYSHGAIKHAEITPPLMFVASWVTTRLGHSPELLRLPALLAGTATIPLIFVVGRSSVGRRAALVAAGLTTFSPFMIYYSAEARAYGLMMFLVLASTLSILRAIDTKRRAWWVAYALFAAAAFYTHYTSLFVLGVQLVWVLWAEPSARRPALIASVAAALLVIPWVPGLIQDFKSPTLKILSALSPFGASAIRIDIEHWAVGYPYSAAGGLKALPGVPALLLLLGAAVLTVGGLAVRLRHEWVGGGDRWAWVRRFDRRIVLVVALAIAAPVGETLASAVGNHIIGVRDLAVSWPYLALAASVAMASAGRVTGLAASAMALVAFVLGAAKMFDARFERPNVQAAANYVARTAAANDVVIDSTPTPGPLTPLDTTLHRRLQVVRALQPAERGHPFGFTDPPVPLRTAVGQALTAANGARVFLVAPVQPGANTYRTQLQPVTTAFEPGYRLVSLRSWAGLEPTLVAVYAPIRR